MTTETQRNEAAERLRYWYMDEGENRDSMQQLVDEALAAERRATVERIRQTVVGLQTGEAAFASVRISVIRAILDEEAARGS